MNTIGVVGEKLLQVTLHKACRGRADAHDHVEIGVDKQGTKEYATNGASGFSSLKRDEIRSTVMISNGHGDC